MSIAKAPEVREREDIVREVLEQPIATDGGS